MSTGAIQKMISPGFKDLLQSLNEAGVEYLVVGAYALAYHGAPRNTKDLDVYVRPTTQNAKNIVDALNRFGFESLSAEARDLERENTVIQLGHPSYRIDLISGISGVSFEQAWSNRCSATLDGIPVAFIGRAELLKNKYASGRHQDLADAERITALADKK